MSEFWDLLVEAWKWVLDLHWAFWAIVYPALKRWYGRYKDKKEFEEFFGFAWPDNQQEREFIAYSVQQSLIMIKWQSQEAKSVLSNFDKVFGGVGKENLALKQLEKDMSRRLLSIIRAEELAAKANSKNWWPFLHSSRRKLK